MSSKKEESEVEPVANGHQSDDEAKVEVPGTASSSFPLVASGVTVARSAFMQQFPLGVPCLFPPMLSSPPPPPPPLSTAAPVMSPFFSGLLPFGLGSGFGPSSAVPVASQQQHQLTPILPRGGPVALPRPEVLDRDSVAGREYERLLRKREHNNSVRTPRRRMQAKRQKQKERWGQNLRGQLDVEAAVVAEGPELPPTRFGRKVTGVDGAGIGRSVRPSRAAASVAMHRIGGMIEGEKGVESDDASDGEPFHLKDEEDCNLIRLLGDNDEVEEGDNLLKKGKKKGKKKKKEDKPTVEQVLLQANRNWFKDLRALDQNAAAADGSCRKAIELACEWGLVLFQPLEVTKNKSLELQEKKPLQHYRTKSILYDPATRRQILGMQYWVQRNRKQAAAYRALRGTYHGTVGPKGRDKLQREGGKKLRTVCLTNDRNHVFNAKDPFRPVVYNEAPWLDELVSDMVRFTRNNLPEIIEASAVDADRGLRTINVGLSPVQAQEWWQYRPGRKLPGVMKAVHGLSDRMKEFFLKFSNKTVEAFEEHVFADTGLEVFPVGDNEFRHVMMDRLAKALQGPGEPFIRIRAAGIQFMLGNGTLLHIDDMNDHRIHHDYALIVSTVVNIEELGWARDLVNAIRSIGLDPKALPIMMILYGRDIVSLLAEKLKNGFSTDDPCVREFLADLQNPDFQDVERFKKDDPTATKAFVESLYRSATPFFDAGGLITAASRQEGMTKAFFFSCWLDSIFHLLVFASRKHKVKVMVYDLVCCLLFVVRECSGSWLPVRIVQDLTSDTFRGNSQSFRITHRLYPNFFELLSQQAEFVRASHQAHASRYQQATQMLLLSHGKAGIEKLCEEGFKVAVDLHATRHTKKFQAIAEEVHKKISLPENKGGMNGLGHLLSMTFIQLLGRTAVASPCYGQTAFVSENRNYGPGNFFDKYGAGGPGGNVKEQFDELCEGLGDAGFALGNGTVENHCCVKGRKNPVLDWIVFRAKKLMSIFDVELHASAKRYSARIFCNGAWTLLSKLYKPPCDEPVLTKDTVLEFTDKVGDEWVCGMDLAEGDEEVATV